LAIAFDRRATVPTLLDFERDFFFFAMTGAPS
jgi:hypothetical protein